MNVKLNNIVVKKNVILYEYTYDKEASVFFNKASSFFIEYSDKEDFSNVPESVLAVPFVANLLPLSWIFDICLSIDEIDKCFMDSIPLMKQGYQSIFKDVTLGGNLAVENIKYNNYKPSERSVCLFSGGVDATFTFLRHRTENIVLANVWGVDIELDDLLGHLEMESYFNQIADSFNKEYMCIKSSVRTFLNFLNESYLNDIGFKKIQDYWWHGAQHSIGMLSLLSPYNYVYRIKTNYIASSFTGKEYNQGVRCISYPVVDSQMKMASTNCYHDGFETSRIGKIEYICKIRKKDNLKLDIKVCFNYSNGKNCSSCEKCMRTIAALLVYDNSVEEYGFSKKCDDTKQLRAFLDTHEIGIFRWIPIQEAYQKYPVNRKLKWLMHYKFNNLSSFRSRLLRFMKKVNDVMKKR